MFHRMMNYGELEARPTVVLTKELIKKSMPKYKRHEDLLLIQESAWDEFKRSLPIPVVKEENSPFSIDEDELASLVCQTVQKPTCQRLAVDKGVKNDDYRSPNVELILGDTGLVNHRDNHILYQFDVTKCMFSFGNVHEKMRMAELDCSQETVVDLFAGIGYFSLPLLVHAKAKHLYACEWNPDSIKALRKNLTLNKIESSRYTVLEGDNRLNRPRDVAQRVLLGILPSCLDWMRTALECVDKKTGAILHCHDLVDTKPTETAKQTATKQNQSVDPLETSASPSSTSTGAKIQQATTPSDRQSLFDQSITSSSSSHSTIERLSVPTSSSSIDHDKVMTQSSESDKDTSSPVLLEKPANFSISYQNSSNSSMELSTNSSSNNNNNNCCSTTANNDATQSNNLSSAVAPPSSAPNQPEEQEDESIESLTKRLSISDMESSSHEARGLALIASIQNELDSHNLLAKLVHIQPVKSYAPHVNHVVFDIKIEPRINEMTPTTTP